MGQIDIVRKPYLMKNPEIEILQALVSPIGERTGNGFFKALSKALSTTLNVDLTLIVELDPSCTTGQTICAYAPGKELENFSYSLSKTPCENVTKESTCYYPDQVAELFPDDQILIDQNFRSYCGTPLKNSQGKVIGIICVLSQKTMDDEPLVKTTLELVALRASAELERLQYEKELMEARQDAERANEFKSKFIANVSHDLRTPLNGILGFANLLATADLDEKHAEYAHNIHASGTYLVGLIDDLLDLASIENGTMSVVLEDIRIDTVLEAIKPEIKMMAQAKGLFFECTVLGDLVPVSLDQKRLRQVLINLLNNAVKYTRKGMVHLHVEQSSQRLVFSVADTGLGIAPEDQGRIFDRFTRLNSGQESQNSGTGIGLAITRELVELMGGEIEVESVPGKGSRFRVELPIKRESELQEDPSSGDSDTNYAA